MIIKRFEDIVAWQKAQDFAVNIYPFFKGSKDFGFKNQILRAVVSISNNIAEGFDRSSDADFARFLYIAIGSASETKSMIYLAQRLEYLDNKQKDLFIEQLNEISRIIRGLIKSLQ